MLESVTLIAGQAQEFYEAGDFFRVLAGSQSLTVRFYREGKEVARAVGVSGGYAERFQAGGFDRIQLESATTQDVQFVIRLGNQVFYDLPPFGNVNGSFGQAAATVTTSSAQLLPANNFRRYMLIQNKDTTGSVFVVFGAGPATVAGGVRIPPGGSYELTGYTPTNAVQAIGDVASNPNIITIEG